MSSDTSSAPQQPDGAALTQERVQEELKNVVDPEIGLDIVNLGLVYDCTVDNGNVNLVMTLTTPACPYAPQLLASVDSAIRTIPGVTNVKVDLSFTPPWDPRTMASEEAKMMLGIYY